MVVLLLPALLATATVGPVLGNLEVTLHAAITTAIEESVPPVGRGEGARVLPGYDPAPLDMLGSNL